MNATFKATHADFIEQNPGVKDCVQYAVIKCGPSIFSVGISSDLAEGTGEGPSGIDKRDLHRDLFTAYWQYNQIKQCRQNPEEDDTIHDHHVVHEFSQRTLAELRKSIERRYYSSEHEKGESDGETGILSQALKRATRQGLNFDSAKDMVDYLGKALGRGNRTENRFPNVGDFVKLTAQIPKALTNVCSPIDSFIHTDSLASYNKIVNLPVQPAYQHLVVIHDQNFVNPVTGPCINHIEYYWKICMKHFKCMSGVQNTTLDSHLEVYVERDLQHKWTGGIG
ncbi:hypothetical protein RRG08_053938 [Elysia crispata]|uniref:ISXO2-like transposase domain-containing protein n=1 Tax=Elysia crispata TaxID=231223 RepID=A0AAE1DER5_9GAST|nr:hypothetical protein RRG08_053938 [Elysia crispata]